MLGRLKKEKEEEEGDKCSSAGGCIIPLEETIDR